MSSLRETTQITGENIRENTRKIFFCIMNESSYLQQIEYKITNTHFNHQKDKIFSSPMSTVKLYSQIIVITILEMYSRNLFTQKIYFCQSRNSEPKLKQCFLKEGQAKLPNQTHSMMSCVFLLGFWWSSRICPSNAYGLKLYLILNVDLQTLLL